jgi:phage terminase large subunit GpA-like protein
VKEALSARELIGRALYAPLKPPPRRSISEWADDKFYLSAESSAEAGKWTSMPFQRGILDAFSDARVTYVSVMKSARVGWTKIINIVAARHIDEDPCSIMIVQPTVEDAEGYSKEEIAPMLRDVPCLAGKVSDAKSRDSDNTIATKKYPGGVLSFVGANSGRGFRRVSRRIVLLDEIDAYPLSAGKDGDQYRLAEKRTLWFWDRKVGAGSTPLVHQTSRIRKLFLAGDQRRYYVPCPHCGHMDYLVFSKPKASTDETERDDDEARPATPGHFMAWDKDAPESAHFVCSDCGACIEETHKHWMVERGEWRAAKAFNGHASFHIWAAYSYAPNAGWSQIVKEFLEASKAGPDELRTLVNTVLGETWRERGEAPEWERLYRRRENYPRGSVPPGALFLTAGVDVQRDRLVFEIVGWGRGKISWSIDSDVLIGDTSSHDNAVWLELDAFLARKFSTPLGVEMPIWSLAVDSGDQTQVVYNWARRYEMPRVIAVKGVDARNVLVGAPSPVDVSLGGKKIANGYKVWPVSGDVAKGELYGWLRLPEPTAEGALHPSGFCHFPEYGEDYFKQLTAEQKITTRDRKGFPVMSWELKPGRQNHVLDCRVYARAAAQVIGLDRFRESDWITLERNTGQLIAPVESSAPVTAPAAPAAPRSVERSQSSSWIPSRPGWLDR